MAGIRLARGTAAATVLAAFMLMAFAWMGQGQDMPFGDKEDIAFAQKVWKAMEGYHDWRLKTDILPGRSPHGKFVRTYFSILNFDNEHYLTVVKDNFGGQDVTLDQVSKSPDEYLVAVTVMVKRKPGYDSDNQNWFWVKYDKDGTIDKDGQGVALAGRVAKGTGKGCIACHKSAQGGDYFFTND